MKLSVHFVSKDFSSGFNIGATEELTYCASLNQYCSQWNGGN
jgi:hypothetical protein